MSKNFLLKYKGRSNWPLPEKGTLKKPSPFRVKSFFDSPGIFFGNNDLPFHFWSREIVLKCKKVWKNFAYVGTVSNFKVDAVLVEMARIYNKSFDKVNY